MIWVLKYRALTHPTPQSTPPTPKRTTFPPPNKSAPSTPTPWHPSTPARTPPSQPQHPHNKLPGNNPARPLHNEPKPRNL